MGIYVPSMGNAFGWRVRTMAAGTRPTGADGVQLTPGNNTFGTPLEILSAAQLTQDVYRLVIVLGDNDDAGQSRDTLVNILVDPAGGTSWSTVLIPDLFASCAPATARGLYVYAFPLWVRAGSSIAAAASINNATVGNCRVYATAYGRPRDPARTKVGTYVRAYGATEASSSGTAITPGTTSEGAWAELGTIAAGDTPWWWQVGLGIEDSTMTSEVIHASLGVGDATNKFIAIEDQEFITNAAEYIQTQPPWFGCEFHSVAGQKVYGQAQISGAADNAYSMIGYGLGG